MRASGCTGCGGSTRTRRTRRLSCLRPGSPDDHVLGGGPRCFPAAPPAGPVAGPKTHARARCRAALGCNAGVGVWAAGSLGPDGTLIDPGPELPDLVVREPVLLPRRHRGHLIL